VSSSSEIREIGKTPPVPIVDGRGKRRQGNQERREPPPKKEEEAPRPEGKIDYRA
jgi:hypothetical protein